MESLRNISKDEYSDMGNALTQDKLNALIGIVDFVFILLFIGLLIVFFRKGFAA